MARGRHAELTVDQAKRVRQAMIDLHRERYGGNASAMSREFGISQASISQILSGRNAPSFSTATRLAEMTDVAIWALLGMDPGAPVAPDLRGMQGITSEEEQVLEVRPNLMAALDVAIKGKMCRFPSAMAIIRVAKSLPDFSQPTWLAMLYEFARAPYPDPDAQDDANARRRTALMIDLTELYEDFRDGD